MSEYKNDSRPRRPLRETVADIDRDILRLLLRRHNILLRMRNSKGFLEPAEEKVLRQSWESAASRISHDPRLTGRFFSLMQEVEFMPRPVTRESEDGEQVQEAPRSAFNLAPPQRPVRLSMPAPLDDKHSRAWLLLAAASGQAMRLGPCLQNDAIVDCVKALDQMGAALTREEQTVAARVARPLERPDKVLHMGGSILNFYLLLGYYLGAPSRAKFTGEAELKLADLSAVRRFLPQMGARLTHVVPRSDGLPVRLECSGILPESLDVPANLPAGLVEGILLSAPFYEKALRLDLTAHPDRDSICGFVLPLLQTIGVQVSREGSIIHICPGPVSIPDAPKLPMEPALAAPLLTLPAVLGGEVRLEGNWPQGAEDALPLDILRSIGLELSVSRGEDACIIGRTDKPLGGAFAIPTETADWLPLAAALAAITALRGEQAHVSFTADGKSVTEVDLVQMDGFFFACGLERDEQGVLSKKSQDGTGENTASGWNAPSPAWAMALALAACARDVRQGGFKLGNPGIMMSLYPGFWALYNSLPEPAVKRPQAQATVPAPTRRRIRTNAVAVPPEMPDEDMR